MTYDYWRNALVGNFGAVHDGHPQPGFYKRKTGKDGPWVPVAIWHQEGEMVAFENFIAANADEIWTWVCRYPITEDLYRRLEKGEPWPDAIETMIGSNNPPNAELQTDEIDSAIAAALAELAKVPETQTDADRLANHRDRLAKLYKAQETERKTKKQPHIDAGAAVDAAFKPILAKLEEAGKKVKQAITAWMLKEEDRRRREALEQMRRGEEARKAAALANLPPPEPAPLPEVERPKAGTAGRATALRTYKNAVITDYAKALAHFADNAEVKELIQTLADRAARADVAVPGCEIKEERRAA